MTISNDDGELPFTQATLATRTVVDGDSTKTQKLVLYIYHKIEGDERVYIWEDLN